MNHNSEAVVQDNSLKADKATIQKRNSIIYRFTTLLLPSVLFVLLILTIRVNVLRQCVGAGFLEINPSFGTGKGRCDLRDSVGFSFTQRKVVLWYTSYQGDFLDGKIVGQGLFTKWRMWFGYDLFGYEGKDKLSYNGAMKDNVREGYGSFEIYGGSSLAGIWHDDSLSGANCSLTFKPTAPESNQLLKGGISYKGQVSKSLMDGEGRISSMQTFGADSFSLDGLWSNGRLVKVTSASLGKKQLFAGEAIQIQGVPNAIEITTADGHRATYFSSVNSWSRPTIKYHSEPTGEFSDLFRSLANSDKSTSKSVEDSFEVLAAVEYFQEVFLKNQPLSESFRMPSINQISARRVSPLKYWF
eukprot:TRINITY_DN3812_c0_g1_i3.p1 TRINITY_DN3812_c0_g1~~TRINITY_DN3812_c0_g1_i3.p1  ORF type:complete len:357 (+),score=43.08 TRINITY_DN3812_c0_g1_i3:44-1114(+)